MRTVLVILNRIRIRSLALFSSISCIFWESVEAILCLNKRNPKEGVRQAFWFPSEKQVWSSCQLWERVGSCSPAWARGEGPGSGGGENGLMLCHDLAKLSGMFILLDLQPGKSSMRVEGVIQSLRWSCFSSPLVYYGGHLRHWTKRECLLCYWVAVLSVLMVISRAKLIWRCDTGHG